MGAAQRLDTGLTQIGVEVILGRSHRDARIVTSGWNVDLFERGIARDLAIGHTVLGHAACNAYPIQTRQCVEATEYVKDDLLTMALH